MFLSIIKKMASVNQPTAFDNVFVPIVRPSIRNLYLKLKGAERIIERDALFKKINNNNKIEFNNKKFNIIGEKLTEENANVDKNIPQLFGWLPYVKNKTNLVIYHFFSYNYALRKQFLLRLSLVKNLNVVCQKLFWLPAHSVEEINLKEVFENEDGETLGVELFHPKIPKNHGGGDGQLRCWGKYYTNEGLFCAITHTLVYYRKIKYSPKQNFGRRFITKEKFSTTYNYGLGTKKIFKNEKDKSHSGFSIVMDENQNPKTVWHHGGFAGTKIKPKSSYTKRNVQGFWCPSSKELDPIIYIDSRETILSEDTVNFFVIKNKKIVKKKEVKIKGSFSSKVSEIFNEHIDGPYIVLGEFSYNSFSYMHVQYNTKNSPGDLVHAHECNWSIENESVKPKMPIGKGVARKFFHFQKKISQDENQYLILHLNEISGKKSIKVKLRVLTDSKEEFLITKDFLIDEPVVSINIREIFPKIDEKIKKVGILQIESAEDNIVGSFIHHNAKKDIIAVDHLTGG